MSVEWAKALDGRGERMEAAIGPIKALVWRYAENDLDVRYGVDRPEVGWYWSLEWLPPNGPKSFLGIKVEYDLEQGFTFEEAMQEALSEYQSTVDLPIEMTGGLVDDALLRVSMMEVAETVAKRLSAIDEFKKWRHWKP